MCVFRFTGLQDLDIVIGTDEPATECSGEVIILQVEYDWDLYKTILKSIMLPTVHQQDGNLVQNTATLTKIIAWMQAQI